MTPPRTRKPWYRRAWHVSMRTLRGVLRLEDTPYRIAIACACGVFSAVLPVLGQMLVGMALTKLLRGNVIASMPWTWITNPATTPFIWYGCYRVGAGLLMREPLTIETLRAVVTRAEEQGLWTTLYHSGALLGQLALPLVLGCLVVGLALGAIAYAVVRPLVVRVQARRAAKARRWAASHLATGTGHQATTGDRLPDSPESPAQGGGAIAPQR